MNRLMCVLIAPSLLSSLSSGQRSSPADTSYVFKVNFHIQPFDDEKDYQRLLSSLNGFLKTKNKSDTSNMYWEESDFKRYHEPYRDLYWIEYSVKFKRPDFFKPILLDIASTPDSAQYIVKLMYTGPDTLGVGTMNCIYNIVAVRKPGGNYKFRSALGMNTANWHTKKIGTITYIYKDRLDSALAEKTNQFNLELAGWFQVKPIDLVYYKCEDPVELFRIKGFDYTALMYTARTGGRAEGENTVMAANNSEWYPHEIVHFYTGVAFEKRSRVIDEGYATYLGGEGGRSLEESLRLVSRFYREHPERNILDDVMNNYLISDDIQVMYAVGGLVCKLADERYGFEGIKRLFKEEELPKALRDVLGVENPTEFLKAELAKYSK